MKTFLNRINYMADRIQDRLANDYLSFFYLDLDSIKYTEYIEIFTEMNRISLSISFQQ